MYHDGSGSRYTVHVPDKANAKKRKRQPGRRKPHRWIVEVAHSWINRFSPLALLSIGASAKFRDRL